MREERVFRSVPAEEVGGLGVRGVVCAGSPYLVKKEEAGFIYGVVQIVLQEAFFFTSGADQCADLRLPARDAGRLWSGA